MASSKEMAFSKETGLLGLGVRLRGLGDRLQSKIADVYRSRGVGIEPRAVPLLRLLSQRDGRSVGEAAEALGVSHAAVSQMQRSLAAAGLTETQRDPRDERRHRLALTPSGIERAAKLEPLWDALTHALRELVGAEELPRLDRLEAELRRAGLRERLRDATRVGVEILRYQPQYAKDFRRLNLEWLEAYFRVEPVDEEVLGDPEGVILCGGGSIFFARVDGEIVGTCALLRQGAMRFELTKMAVTEKQRGRGIGRALIDAAIRDARDAGARELFLVTNSSMKASIGLYESSGFRITRRGAHPKYERGDLTMKLALR